jgi:glycosyltransferase involved in cell wall biosynthesis
MIVKNEEETLTLCLNSVKPIVDEIIIVDTGSSDRTKEIAYSYTDKVFDFKWIEDFSAARNYSFSKATKNFILWLDADDIILKDDREIFLYLKEDLTLQIDVVMMKYVLKRDEAGKDINSFYRERMVKRSKGYQWHEPVHEYLNIDGIILHTDIAVTHKKDEKSLDGALRNLKILKKLISNGHNINPRHIFYYARENQILGNWEEAKKYYLKLLDRDDGIDSQYIEGCLQLASMYFKENNGKEAIKVLIRSFKCGGIRAEVLCFFGQYYRENKDFLTAISWYELALSLTKPKYSWQFILHEYWDLIPYLELCHCYYQIGDIEKAKYYHDKTCQLKPYHSGVLENKKFFETLS